MDTFSYKQHFYFFEPVQETLGADSYCLSCEHLSDDMCIMCINGGIARHHTSAEHPRGTVTCTGPRDV